MAERLSLPAIGARDAALDAAVAAGHPASALKPGVLAPNAIAVAGLDGYLFIADGANRWERQYRGELSVAPAWLEAWGAVLRQRRAEAAARGVRLVNFVAPEKQVAYPAKRWGEPPPSGEGRPLRLLLAHLGGAEAVVYPEAALAAAQRTAPVFFRHNSHWTPWGCCAALAPLLAACDVAAPIEEVSFAYATRVGRQDLTAHFFDPPPVEESGWLQPAGELVFDNRNLELTGRHAGSRYTVRNPDAPDSRKLILFGDSYAYDAGLTAALSAVFAEVAFVWSKDVDWALVAEHRADLVVWESAERFLATLPQA